MTTARIAWIDRSQFRLFTAYSRRFVEALKNEIDYDGRRWDPETKTWVCASWAYGTVVRLCHRHYDKVIADERPGSRPPQQLASPFSTLGLRDDCTREVFEAAYKALLKTHHPDVAGTDFTAKMAAINDARDQIKILKGW